MLRVNVGKCSKWDLSTLWAAQKPLGLNATVVWTAPRFHEADCEKRSWAAVGSGNEGLFIDFPERYSGWGASLKTFAWVSNTTLLGMPVLSEAASAGDHRCTVGGAW